MSTLNDTQSTSSPHAQLAVVSPPYDPDADASHAAPDQEISQLQTMQLDYLKHELVDLDREWHASQDMHRKRLDAVHSQIRELERMQEAAGHPPRSHAWNVTDTVVSWVLIGASALTMIPIFFVLFGLIGQQEAAIRWVSFGLAAFAVCAAVFTWLFAKRLPKSKAAAIAFLGTVLMLGFAWLV